MARKHIAVIGTGPIGLETALYAQALGYEVKLFERAEIAANVRAWDFVRLFSPWSMNMTPLSRRALRQADGWREPPAEICPTGRELRENYLLPLAHSAPLRDAIHADTRVIAVGKNDYAKSDAIGSPSRADSPFRLLVSDKDDRERVEEADIVFDCSGTYGHHRWAGRGGVPAPGELALAEKIWYTLPDILGRDQARFANRHTLLLGCGYSSATVLDQVQQLLDHAPGTRLSWAIRRPGQALQAIRGDTLPARRELVANALRLADAPPPWLQFLGTCVLERLVPGPRIAATLRSMQTSLALEVDEVVALVGYTPDSGIYEQLQIHQCYATCGPIKLAAALLGEANDDCLMAGSSVTPETLKNPEPSFFILGAKSYGTNSNFLMRIGHQQIVDAFKLVQGDESVNLYKM